MNVRAELTVVAKDMLAYHEAKTIPLAPNIMTVKAKSYTDPDQFEREKRLLFRRLPVMLAPSCELPSAGDYKTMDVAGVPIVVVRGKDGQVRTFLNACTHRASQVAQGCGRATRFVCPYHGWTFDAQGDLVGIAINEEFGAETKGALGLKRLPTLERAGLIWAILDPASTLDLRSALAGYDELLAEFGLETWHFVESRVLKGPNWKLAFDAHLEFYHIPVLHRTTLKGEGHAVYYVWGPHQRLISQTRGEVPARRVQPKNVDIYALKDESPSTWPTEAMMLGEWILFPNVSINTFYAGGRSVFISQIFPGEDVGESYTVQTTLMADKPDAAGLERALENSAFLAHVVGDEDLATSLRQQQALKSGLIEEIRFGRNEGGLQYYHSWLDELLAAPDDELGSLLQNQQASQPAPLLRRPLEGAEWAKFGRIG